MKARASRLVKVIGLLPVKVVKLDARRMSIHCKDLAGRFDQTGLPSCILWLYIPSRIKSESWVLSKFILNRKSLFGV